MNRRVHQAYIIWQPLSLLLGGENLPKTPIGMALMYKYRRLQRNRNGPPAAPQQPLACRSCSPPSQTLSASHPYAPRQRPRLYLAVAHSHPPRPTIFLHSQGRRSQVLSSTVERPMPVKVASLSCVINAKTTGACGYNRPCAHQYVGKYQSCMVQNGRLYPHAPVCFDSPSLTVWHWCGSTVYGDDGNEMTIRVRLKIIHNIKNHA